MNLKYIGPLFIIGSFQEGFLYGYPVYKDYGVHKTWNVPGFVNVLMFEVGYGLGFISMKLFFREFLISPLSQTMGRAAIIPMACLYCTFHFGKSAGETISSFFGETILGIFTCSTRYIYGGIINPYCCCLFYGAMCLFTKKID